MKLQYEHEGYEEELELEDDLPLGIFPEVHPESCHHALRRHGLPCTRLNAELFYEMGQLERNRLLGCSTEELAEIDIWDQLSGTSVWDEPIAELNKGVLPPEERLDNLNRQARWEHVLRFLRDVFRWCQTGAAPEIMPHRNRQGRLTWRFQQLSWTEEGILPEDSAHPKLPAGPTEILQAAWGYLFWCRRRWLKAHPGKVWLSEHCLHLMRQAFRALLEYFSVPEEDWPAIKEEPKPIWPNELEAKLAELEERERRAIKRLHSLQRWGLLTETKLRQASKFLDDLAEDINRTHRRLDEALVRLARQHGYDDGYWGTRLELSQLSPDELLELREEIRIITAADPEPREDPPLSGYRHSAPMNIQPPIRPDLSQMPAAY
jgi:hypothetical protein